MSELDNLLQDLKSSKYGQSLERRHNGERNENVCDVHEINLLSDYFQQTTDAFRLRLEDVP